MFDYFIPVFLLHLFGFSLHRRFQDTAMFLQDVGSTGVTTVHLSVSRFQSFLEKLNLDDMDAPEGGAVADSCQNEAG